MKKYIGTLIVGTLLVASNAMAITKPELRGEYSLTKVVPRLTEITSIVESISASGTDAYQAAIEFQKIEKYSREWLGYCKRIDAARDQLASIKHSEADDEIWQRSFSLQLTGCEKWKSATNTLFFKYGAYVANPNFPLAMLKQSVKNELINTSTDVFSDFMGSVQILGLLSPEWDIPEEPKLEYLEPFRVGNKIDARDGNSLINIVRSGNSNYQLIALNKEHTQQALSFLRAFKQRELKGRANIYQGSLLSVNDGGVDKDGDRKSTLVWGGKDFMSPSYKVNQFAITGLDVLSTNDPVVMVRISMDKGDDCSAKKMFVLGKGADGKVTATNEFGDCESQAYEFPSQSRVYFVLSPGKPDVQVAVLQKQ